MSFKVPLRELEEQLPALLDLVARDGEECVVQRNGKDYAVIISVQEWRRRNVGRRLDALGANLRLDAVRQARAEHLLAVKSHRALTAAEQRELRSLLRESDAILRRHAAALDRRP